MAWGKVTQPADLGVGTTGQIEDAHKALDAIGIPPGKLALRVLQVAGVVDRLRDELA